MSPGVRFRYCSVRIARGLAAYSDLDGVFVPPKRQWPDADMYPETRGGLIAHNVLEVRVTMPVANPHYVDQNMKN
jgi:hypothetical protein